MKALTGVSTTAALIVLIVGVGSPASTQVAVTTADIQRLQDAAYEIAGDIARLRSRASEAAVRPQTELDDLRDEITYLKVKMRKERNVSRNEYAELRDRLEDLRSRARGDEVGAARSGAPGAASTGGTRAGDRGAPSRAAGRNEVPVGTEIDVRLQSPLNSGTAQVEDRFEATTVVDLLSGDDVLIPAGSVLRGVVSSVDKASRTDRKGSLTVAVDQITVRGRSYPMRGTVTQALESEGLRGEAARIGTGAGVGAIIGGILGGVRGALAGILIGGGGVIAATEGKDVNLPAGTVLRVRFDSPLTLR